MKCHELDINQDLIERAHTYLRSGRCRSTRCVIALAITEQLGFKGVCVGASAIAHYDTNGRKNNRLLLGKVARQVRDAFDDHSVHLEPCKIYVYE